MFFVVNIILVQFAGVIITFFFSLFMRTNEYMLCRDGNNIDTVMAQNSNWMEFLSNL